jgi:hypothetical protein
VCVCVCVCVGGGGVEKATRAHNMLRRVQVTVTDCAV